MRRHAAERPSEFFYREVSFAFLEGRGRSPSGHGSRPGVNEYFGERKRMFRLEDWTSEEQMSAALQIDRHALSQSEGSPGMLRGCYEKGRGRKGETPAADPDFHSD